MVGNQPTRSSTDSHTEDEKITVICSMSSSRNSFNDEKLKQCQENYHMNNDKNSNPIEYRITALRLKHNETSLCNLFLVTSFLFAFLLNHLKWLNDTNSVIICQTLCRKARERGGLLFVFISCLNLKCQSLRHWGVQWCFFFNPSQQVLAIKRAILN